MTHVDPERFDVDAIRADFPILGRRVRGTQPLIYLDSGATSQKPLRVLDAEREFYVEHNAAVHRAPTCWPKEATDAYEGPAPGWRPSSARTPRDRVHEKHDRGHQPVDVLDRNASTDGSGPDRLRIGPGDEILVTELEHHANLVPWQQLCQRTGATLRWVTVTPDGRLDEHSFERLIGARTRFVAVRTSRT